MCWHHKDREGSFLPVPVRLMAFEDDPHIRQHFVRQPPSNQTGVATIAEHLLERVTQYHAQIGAQSKVSLAHLRELEHKLVEEARELCIAQRWDEALNTFTHALAMNAREARNYASRTQLY